MKNVSHKKTWNAGVTQVHLDPPPTPLMKSKQDDKSDNDCIKLKSRRDMLSERLEPYELNMALFDNGEPKVFLLSVHNFNMTIAASGMLTEDVNI